RRSRLTVPNRRPAPSYQWVGQTSHLPGSPAKADLLLGRPREANLLPGSPERGQSAAWVLCLGCTRWWAWSTRYLPPRLEPYSEDRHVCWIKLAEVRIKRRLIAWLESV